MHNTGAIAALAAAARFTTAIAVHRGFCTRVLHIVSEIACMNSGTCVM